MTRGGRRGGCGPGRRARGVDGGGTREQCGSSKAFTAPLTIGLIWLVTRGGGVGGVGQGGGQGGVDGAGAPESSVGATRRSLVPFSAPLKT